MKLITPYTGVEIDVPAPFVERYKANGYVEAKEAPKKEKKAETPKEEVVDEPVKEEKPKTKKK